MTRGARTSVAYSSPLCASSFRYTTATIKHAPFSFTPSTTFVSTPRDLHSSVLTPGHSPREDRPPQKSRPYCGPQRSLGRDLNEMRALVFVRIAIVADFSDVSYLEMWLYELSELSEETGESRCVDFDNNRNIFSSSDHHTMQAYWSIKLPTTMERGATWTRFRTHIQFQIKLRDREHQDITT